MISDEQFTNQLAALITRLRGDLDGHETDVETKKGSDNEETDKEEFANDEIVNEEFLLVYERGDLEDEDWRQHLHVPEDARTYVMNGERIHVHDEQSVTVGSDGSRRKAQFAKVTAKFTVCVLLEAVDERDINLSDSMASLLIVDTREERERLARRLRDPSCGHVLASLRQVLADLSDASVNVVDKAWLFQRFLRSTRQTLETHMLWTANEDVDSTVSMLADYVGRKIRPSVYGVDQGDLQVQHRFSQRLAKQSSIAERGLNPFQSLSQAKHPRQAGEALVNLVHSLSNGEGSSTTEDLLGALIGAIEAWQPRTLIHDVLFVQRFHDHSLLEHGELSYCFTTTLGAINSIMDDGQFMPAKLPTPTLTVTRQDVAGEMRRTNSTSSLSDVASSFLHTIVLVPRAVGAAVVDTIHGRRDGPPTIVEEKKDQVSEARPLGRPSDIQAKALGASSLEDVTLREWRLMFEDYRRILQANYRSTSGK